MGIQYGIIGSGAIGCFYGAKLIQAGCDVHFLFHSDFEHVRKNGLRVDSVDGDMFFPKVNAYGQARDMPVCDVVLVALKSTQNHLLPGLLEPVVGPHTAIVLLQNGLGGEQFIAEKTRAEHILGGLCLVCCNKLGPGHITHLEYGKILLAQYDKDEQPAGITQTMHHIAAPFQKAGIPIDLSQDLVLARWKKLMWNIPFNGTCALLDAPTDKIMACPQSRQLALDLMQEVQAGAASQKA
ncbi:2-dehydropantoate 2-reductase [Desulfoplanes sp. PS50]